VLVGAPFVFAVYAMLTKFRPLLKCTRAYASDCLGWLVLECPRALVCL
jgi:hypothetical protein